MDILNLDPSFEPYGPNTLTLTKDNVFFGGEVDLNIAGTLGTDKTILITARIKNSVDVMRLLVATDVLRHEKGAKRILVFLPYLPYARQDRAQLVFEDTVEHKAFSLRAFARLLNAQNYDGVFTFEAHSIIAERQIKKLTNIGNDDFVRCVLGENPGAWLVYPDAGAYKRYGTFHAAWGLGDVCVCQKHRDPNTQRIIDMTVSTDDFGGRDAYIIDDIIDGGRTFIEVAKELKKRNVGAVNLIASHGLFSYGEQPLKDGGIDHVYVTDSFRNLAPSDFVTQVKLYPSILIPITKLVSRAS